MKVGALLVIASLLTAHATDYTNFARAFSFGSSNGAHPYANLIEASDGRLYGTTAYGGLTNDAFPNGMGTILGLNKDGTGFNVLHYFGTNSPDGANPHGELVEGRFGALYGTTRDGGKFGKGAVFKLNKNGRAFYLLHSFRARNDGSYPEAGLLRATFETPRHQTNSPRSLTALERLERAQVAELYGTTFGSGWSSAGSMFKLRESGAGYRTIHSIGMRRPDSGVAGVWSGGAGGAWSTPVRGHDGSVYSTSLRSTLYAPTTDGAVLMLPRGHSRFDEAFSEQFAEDPPPIHGSPIYMPGPNLQFPAGRLLKASDGFFYGTIVAGGPGQGGAVFRFADAPDRQFSIILNFSDSDQAGVYLKAGLVEGPDGLLYGTTSSDYVNPAEGVERFSGAVFRLNKDGSGLTVLKRFPTSGIDGANPQANLFFGSNGVIYGTTPAGGETGHGTIFVLYP